MLGFRQRTMCQTDCDFVQMQNTDSGIDRNANMLSMARNADLTADMKPCGTTGDLFQRRMGSTCDRACADMIFVDQPLTLCGNDGTLDDLLDHIEIPAAEVNCRRTNTTLKQTIAFYLLFFA